MKKEVLKEPIFAEKILRIIRSSPSMEEMREQLRDYHDNDIAQSLKYLNRAERNLLYSALDAEWLAEIISYIDDPVEYVDEIGIDKLSRDHQRNGRGRRGRPVGEHRRKRQGQAAPDDRRPDQGRDPAHQFL